MWYRRDLKQDSRIHVFLVDDNLTFLRNAKQFLKQQPELVVIGSARGGANALVKAKELRPEVIVIDLFMPGLSGLETISHLRNMLPEVGMFALNVQDSAAIRQSALAAGADDVIAKANMRTNLLPVIRWIARRR